MGTVIRRIDVRLDKEIIRLQSEMLREEGKPVSYPKASGTFAAISFNGKTNVKEALKKLGESNLSW